MICKKCGCRVSDSAAFCDKCGASMAEFGQKEVSAPQKAKSPEERKKKIIIIALIVLGVLAVLFGVKKIETSVDLCQYLLDEALISTVPVQFSTLPRASSSA